MALDYANLPIRQELWFQIYGPEEKVIAQASAHRQPSRSTERVWMIASVHVDPKHRKQGLAGRILESVITLLGDDYLFLHVDPYGEGGLSADQLVKLYEGYGFKLIESEGPMLLMSRKPPEPEIQTFDPDWRGSPVRAFYCDQCNSLLKAYMVVPGGYALECSNQQNCDRVYRHDYRSPVYRSEFEAWDAFLCFTHEKKAKALFGGCLHAGITPHVLQPAAGLYVIFCSHCKQQLSPVLQSLEQAWSVYMPQFEAERRRILEALWMPATNVSPSFQEMRERRMCGCPQSGGRPGTIIVAVTEHTYYHERCKACLKATSNYVSYETAIAMGLIERT